MSGSDSTRDLYAYPNIESRRSWSIRRQVRLLLLVVVASLPAVLVVRYLAAREPQPTLQKAPELTQIDHWINSDGLKIAHQKGKVVVLHFWTFACVNCQHNLPYYNKWQADFAKDDVLIIGVHTPETSFEADPKERCNASHEAEIKYPVAIDGDGAAPGKRTRTASGPNGTSPGVAGIYETAAVADALVEHRRR